MLPRFVLVLLAGIVAMAVAVPNRVYAQALRGVVVDRSDRPVPGVVLLLVDATSLVAARALSNERGEFRLGAPRAGAYRLRTMRIGFRPVESDLLTLSAGADVVQRLVLTGVAFSLDTVRVVGQNACRAVADSGAATFAVWEQVRTALTATQLTNASRGVAMTTLTYQRALDPGNRRVRRQSAAMRTEFNTQPWFSLTPEALRRDGYVRVGPDLSTTFHAPGLDVLLSDVFLEDHCFRLTNEQGRLGIAFEPTRERNKIPEIRGTLWLDKATSELRSMEMGYVNIDRDQERAAGSEMSFVRMKNGAWAISQWSIRMPVMAQRLRTGSLGGTPVYVSELRVEGGELVMARVGRDTIWSQPPRVMFGSVVDSVSGAPISRAQVALDGTLLRDSTNDRGMFRLAGVLPGEYTLAIRTPSLDSASAVHQSTVSFTDATVTHQVRVPTAQQIASSICTSRTEYNGIVMGTVAMREGGTPPVDTKVRVEWDNLALRTSGGSVSTSHTVRQLETRTDARGVFRVCGVPTATNLRVHLESDSAIADAFTTTIPATGRFARADMTFDRLAPGLATLSGVVLADSTRQPLRSAEVSLPGLSKTVTTNERGSFRITAIPPGEHQFTVRRIGYGIAETRLTFVANKTLDRQVLLRRSVILDTVATVERAALPSFEEHRRLGLGKFFTREQIQPKEGMHLGSILGDVQGIVLVHGPANTAYILPNRARRHPCQEPDLKCLREHNVTRPTGVNSGPLRCYSQVYLDNMLMNPGRPTDAFDVNSIPPNTIEALEYYSSNLQIPHKYNNANADCGVLVIWTRRAR